MGNQIISLESELFEKAIFETIRLWITSEYNYSRILKDAFNGFKKNSNGNWYELFKLEEIYTKFLSDYSIARTRQKSTQKEMLKLIFKFLYVDDENNINPSLIDNIAEKIQKKELSAKHNDKFIKPTSLVSKTVFLIYPQKIILYDSRGIWSLKKHFQGRSIDSYKVYYELFCDLYKSFEDDSKEIIRNFLIDNYDILNTYYGKYIGYLKNKEPEASLTILIYNDININWLYFRSLDKYLWYYYEKHYAIKNKK